MEKTFEEKDLIDAYLQLPVDVLINGKLTRRKSPLIAALVEARSITGRNEKTGILEDFNKSGSWAGAMVYMACIDHIGGLFTEETKNNNDFCNCLRTFNCFSLSEIKIKALYALRNSFMHDFSLFNIRKDHKGNITQDMTHSFVVTKDQQMEVVILPELPWNGDIKNHSANKTRINLTKLGDLVEAIHTTLLEKFHNDDLKVFDRKTHQGADKINTSIQYLVNQDL